MKEMNEKIKAALKALKELEWEITYTECSEEEPFDFIIDGVGVYVEGEHERDG